jgi:hypothetical protein
VEQSASSETAQEEIIDTADLTVSHDEMMQQPEETQSTEPEVPLDVPTDTTSVPVEAPEAVTLVKESGFNFQPLTNEQIARNNATIEASVSQLEEVPQTSQEETQQINNLEPEMSLPTAAPPEETKTQEQSGESYHTVSGGPETIRQVKTAQIQAMYQQMAPQQGGYPQVQPPARYPGQMDQPYPDQASQQAMSGEQAYYQPVQGYRSPYQMGQQVYQTAPPKKTYAGLIFFLLLVLPIVGAILYLYFFLPDQFTKMMEAIKIIKDLILQ